jgi:hypothetical protein
MVERIPLSETLYLKKLKTVGNVLNNKHVYCKVPLTETLRPGHVDRYRSQGSAFNRLNTASFRKEPDNALVTYIMKRLTTYIVAHLLKPRNVKPAETATAREQACC